MALLIRPIDFSLVDSNDVRLDLAVHRPGPEAADDRFGRNIGCLMSREASRASISLRSGVPWQ